MTQLNLLVLAKQGDPGAIAHFINRILKPKGITARVHLKQDCLLIHLESATVPDQEFLSAFIQLGIMKLEPEPVSTVLIYGLKQGERLPVWQQKIVLKKRSHLQTQENLQTVSNKPLENESPVPTKLQGDLGANPGIVEQPGLDRSVLENLDQSGQAITVGTSKKPNPRVRQVVRDINRRAFLRQLLTVSIVTLIGFLVTVAFISYVDWLDKPRNPQDPKKSRWIHVSWREFWSESCSKSKFDRIL